MADATILRFSKTDLCMYAKVRGVVAFTGLGDQIVNKTIWFGSFRTEEHRTEWLHEFRTKCAGDRRFDIIEIRVTSQGKRTTNRSPFDVDPKNTSVEAACELIRSMLIEDAVAVSA